MQVETVVTIELNQVLGSSREDRQALGKLQVLPEQQSPARGYGELLSLAALSAFPAGSFQVLSSCVQHTPLSAQKVALGRGGDSRQDKSAGMP